MKSPIKPMEYNLFKGYVYLGQDHQTINGLTLMRLLETIEKIKDHYPGLQIKQDEYFITTTDIVSVEDVLFEDDESHKSDFHALWLGFETEVLNENFCQEMKEYEKQLAIYNKYLSISKPKTDIINTKTTAKNDNKSSLIDTYKEIILDGNTFVLIPKDKYILH